MDRIKIRNKNIGIKSITITAPVIVMLLLLVSCGKSGNEIVGAFGDPADIPTLKSLEVSTLVSDSGITRYRITTPEWLMFEKAKEPYWYFPQGIYVEKFDSLFNAEAFIRGDTAIFYKNKQLWELNGNVKMENIKNERFETQQLFWDQRAKRIYSDEFIHIEKEDKIIEGYGFESNEPMTKYTIRKTQGIFPVKQNTPAAQDTLAVDEKEQGEALP